MSLYVFVIYTYALHMHIFHVEEMLYAVWSRTPTARTPKAKICAPQNKRNALEAKGQFGFQLVMG